MMPCNCKPPCHGPCTIEVLKTAMFSQPKREDASNSDSRNLDHRTIQHLDRLFSEHDVADILKIGFNDALVCIHPMLVVSSVGYNEGVLKLLKAGADVNLQNPKDGNTPLILSTKGKHLDTMQILINHNADLTIVNQDGNNAFMVAVTTGAPGTVNLLWQYRKSFDIDFTNKKGYSALLLAAEKCWESCINLLISGGADKNLVSRHGDSALAIAIKANDKKSVNKLLQANVRIIRENKSGDTPICIALSENKMDIFDMIAKAMNSTEKQLYVARKLEQLKIKSFIGYTSVEDYLLSSLFPVLYKLIWHSSFRKYLQQKNFPVAMISAFCRHMTNDELIQRAIQLLIMTMHDKSRLEIDVINDFIQKQGPEIMVKALEFYDSHNRHKQTMSIVSLFMPIIFSCSQEKGMEWLKENWYNVISYLQVFEKSYLQLHYEENRTMIEKVWKEFKANFEFIQKEKADIACAELLQTEAQEKAKLDKREKKKNKKNKKKTSDELSNNNASTDNMQESETASNNVEVTIGIGEEAADDESEDCENSKVPKQKKKRRRRRRGKPKNEQDEPVVIKDEVSVTSSCGPELELSNSERTKFPSPSKTFENAVSKKVVKHRNRILYNSELLPAKADWSNQSCITSESMKSITNSQSSCDAKKELPPLDIPTKLQALDSSVLNVITYSEIENAAFPSVTGKPLVKRTSDINSYGLPAAVSPGGNEPRRDSVQFKSESKPVKHDTMHLSNLINSSPTSDGPLLKLSNNIVSANTTSWADLLKHKDLEFPRLGARQLTGQQNISWNGETKPITDLRIAYPVNLQQLSQLSEMDETNGLKMNRKQDIIDLDLRSCDYLSTKTENAVSAKISLKTENFSSGEPALGVQVIPNTIIPLDNGPTPHLNRQAEARAETFKSGDQTFNKFDPLAANMYQEINKKCSKVIDKHVTLDCGSHKENKCASPEQSLNCRIKMAAQKEVKEEIPQDAMQSFEKRGVTTAPPPESPSPGDVFQMNDFMDEEFPLGKVPILDPRYTNYLTDFRVPEIKPSPLDDVGFLSSDTDDEIDANNSNLSALKPKIIWSSQMPLYQLTKLDDNVQQNRLHQSQQQHQMQQQSNYDAMTAALYNYHNSLWVQQRSGSMSMPNLFNITNYWMPVNAYKNPLNGQLPSNHSQNMFNTTYHSLKGVPARTVKHSNLFANSPSQTHVYKQSVSPMPQYTMNPCVDTSTAGGNSASIWQENQTTSRHDSLVWQLQALPKDKLVLKGNIFLCLDNMFVIGKSAYSENLVLLGMVGKIPVAVKRLSYSQYLLIKENVKKLIQPKYHQEHLIKYLDCAEDEHYGYIAQELCEYNLDEYLHLFAKKKALNPSIDASLLIKLAWQLLKGIQSLHCRCSILHRNLKPSNVLIDSQGSIKLTDFGLMHVTPEGMTVFYENKVGDNCWRPKECTANCQSWMGQALMVHYTLHSDMQVSGMLVHYILTGGIHPYGDNAYDIEMNIARGWPKWKDISNEANHLIRLMLSNEPRERPVITTVLRHPFFWTEKRRYDLMVAVGSELADICFNVSCKNPIMEKLNSVMFQGVSRDWTKLIDQQILEEIETSGNSLGTVCDVLIFIFHVHQNYSKLSLQARSLLRQPHVYFLTRFPNLFIPVYKILKISDWSNRPALKQYL